MNNQNDYTDGIALVLTVFIIIFMYFVYEPLMDYLVYVWYAFKYPLFVGLASLPDKFREFLFSYSVLIPNFVIRNADLNKDILNIALFFKENTFEQIYWTELNSRTAKILFINSRTPFVLLPVSLPILYIVSRKIINKKRFNKVFSIESLGIQEAEVWPQIQPVIYDYEKFIKVASLDEGWFAMSPKPMEYFKNNDLIYYYKNENEDDVENFGSLRFKIKEEEMHRFLVNEIGKPWSGIDSMSQEKKCVLAIILPKLMGNKGLSDKINTKLSRAYSGVKPKIKGKVKIDDPAHIKKLNLLKKEAFEEVDQILSMYFPKNNEKVKFKLFGKNKKLEHKEIPSKIKNIIDSHFYEKVVFSALLQEARKSGVLATCEFIWLKKENRDLWYILSQTGRTACFCETAGAWSHYLTEKKVGRRIATPMVQKAIDAADKYLFETHSNYDFIGDFDED